MGVIQWKFMFSKQRPVGQLREWAMVELGDVEEDDDKYVAGWGVIG